MSSADERVRSEFARNPRTGSMRVVVLVLLLALTAVLVVLATLRSGSAEDPVVGARADATTMGPTPLLDARTDAATRGDVDAPETHAARRVEATALDAREVARDSAVPVKVLVFGSADVVRSQGLVSVASVRVELAFASVGAELVAPALAEARTDEDGVARFEIPVDVFAAARARPAEPNVVARVREPGWQAQFATREMPSSNAGLELSISTARGGTIVGRVVDAEDRGIDAATIEAVTNASPDPRSMATSRSRADGSFELHLVEAVPHDVHATAEHVGTAKLTALGVSFTDPAQAIELRLVGPGRMRGRVRDRRGVAAAGLRLRIEHAQSEVASRIDGFISGPGDARPVRSGAGLTSARVTTDAQGRFDVTGLCRDRYRIGVDSGVRGSPLERLLTEAPVEADGGELELVFERPHLVVRIVDAEGRAVRVAVETPAELADVHTARIGWPAQANVRVSPVDALDPEVDDVRDVRGVAVDDGSFVFEIASGRAYDVCLEGGQLAFATRRVQVAEGAGRIDVELVAETHATGRVLVEVLDVNGEPLEETVRIRLEDPRTNARALELDDGPAVRTPWPPGFEAPVGRWRLVVEGFAETGRHRPNGERARGRGRSEQIVFVLANENTPVTARLPAGARLRITARGSVAPAPTKVAEDPDARKLAGGWVVSPSGRTVQRLEPGSVRARLLQDARAPVPVVFVADLGQGVTTLSESFALGATELSQLLPAGEFTLEARLPDGRVVRAAVELVDGATTDVVIEFPER